MLKYILPVIALAFASSAYAHCGTCGVGETAGHKHDEKTKAETKACCTADGEKKEKAACACTKDGDKKEKSACCTKEATACADKDAKKADKAGEKKAE